MPDQSPILLVEDREDDILLFKKAFQAAQIPNPLLVVRSGEEASQYLSAAGDFSRAAEFPLPDLTILDLNMPGLSGFEVLKSIRTNPALRPLRVVVLSSSEYSRDIDKAYRLGANSFLTKPTDFSEYVELARTIQEYWLQRDSAPEVSRRPV